MFVTTYARYDFSGELTALRGYLYSGPVALCGGPSAAQEQLAGEQAQFYKTMIQDYGTTFGEQQNILAGLTASFQPILNAGINQYGFSAPEQQALTSQATQGTGQAYNQASTALTQALNAKGGSSFIPSGENAQLQEQVGTAAANQQSNQLLNITNEGYQVGRENYLAAAGALSSAAGMYNPLGYSGGATSAGNSAFQSATINQQEGSQWMGLLGGVLGGAATGLGGGLGLGMAQNWGQTNANG